MVLFWLINCVQTFPVGCSNVLLSVEGGQTDSGEDTKCGEAQGGSRMPHRDAWSEDAKPGGFSPPGTGHEGLLRESLVGRRERCGQPGFWQVGGCP